MYYIISCPLDSIPIPEDVPVVPPVPLSATTKPLEMLREDELESWLTYIKLSPLIPKLKAHAASGEMLALCETVEELTDFGCLRAQAKLLLRKLNEVKATGGVPLSLLTPAASVSFPSSAAAPTSGAPGK